MQFTFFSTKFSLSQLERFAPKLGAYVQRLVEISRETEYASAESSINCPFDKRALDACGAVAQSFDSRRLKYIFVIGIGGSNLGAKAVYDALRGQYDSITPARYPKMVWLDTVDESQMNHVRDLLKTLTTEEIAIVLISKSGSTTETVANAESLISAANTVLGSVKDRMVVITDAGSALDDFARQRQIRTAHIPAAVGGRYSVFSAVGLLPLMLAGIDTHSLIAGAQRMRNACLSPDPQKNPALSSAVVLYHHLKKGFIIHDSFIFYPALESAGKWYRQLAGESLGKGGKGFTPTVSIGSTDLHSVGQLYLDGPRDMITSFISVKAASSEKIRNRVLPLVPEITGKSPGDIMEAIVSGVQNAYKTKKLPFMHLRFDSLTERDLGDLLQFKMMEIMYLAKLMKVNAFDQPAVELYKRETRRILQSKR